MPFNHFDILALFYDRLAKPGDPARFAGPLELPVSGKLLDAGGGTGGKSQPLLGMASGIFIADSSMGMLREAQQKKGLVTLCAETEHLPYVNAAFDRIMMVDAIHHVADYRSTAAELWRVLKPGGMILIEEPDIRTMGVKVIAVVEKLALMRSHFKSPQDIEDVFLSLDAVVDIAVENSIAWIVARKRAE